MAPHVSVENQLAEDLHRAMGTFIEEHPQWDQYRLVQAAIAGFLFQQGCKDPSVVRHYLGGLFRLESCTLRRIDPDRCLSGTEIRCCFHRVL